VSSSIPTFGELRRRGMSCRRICFPTTATCSISNLTCTDTYPPAALLQRHRLSDFGAG
ncbi:unnamed protein product, partial [Callosobruchus maculatus]